MVVGVDQYKRIRKMAAEDGLSQREIARRLGISRNTVARYCKGEHVPWESTRRERKPGIVNVYCKLKTSTPPLGEKGLQKTSMEGGKP